VSEPSDMVAQRRISYSLQ